MNVNFEWLGVGISMIGFGVCHLANPGAYAIIAGGIVTVVGALLTA